MTRLMNMKKMNNKLALQAGLYQAGYNEEGEQEYIGTRQQWEKYQELEDKSLENNLEL